MSKHRLFLGVVAAEVLALAILVLLASVDARSAAPGEVDLAEALSLTDLALWTEARYTRHPSQADRFAPFQDGPGALERFPAGSWGPPPQLAPAGSGADGFGSIGPGEP